MQFSYTDHLDDLVRHIDLVRAATLLLGKRLIASGRKDFGRLLIANGFQHDVSKFSGIEWDYLHAGPDVNRNDLDHAITQHVRTNSHHPEYWGGVHSMPEIAVAEMVCDWLARAQEFGTDLREWINEIAMLKYNVVPNGIQHQQINQFTNILLTNSFK